MIISINSKPTLAEFQALMKKTDRLLNDDARSRRSYYVTRAGNPLEDDVKIMLDEAAKNTPFAGTIEKVSGQKFPDIVAAEVAAFEIDEEIFGDLAEDRFFGDVLVVNSVPKDYELDPVKTRKAVDAAMQDVKKNQVMGKAITGYMMGRIKEYLGPESVESQKAFLLNNAVLAAKLAAAICKQTD